MATSEGIPSSIDIEFLELNDNPYCKGLWLKSLLGFPSELASQKAVFARF